MSHTAKRPVWTCTECGELWPCESAREYMLAAWTTVPRALTMSAHYMQATEDLGPEPGLYTRFLGWVSGRPQNP